MIIGRAYLGGYIKDAPHIEAYVPIGIPALFTIGDEITKMSTRLKQDIVAFVHAVVYAVVESLAVASAMRDGRNRVTVALVPLPGLAVANLTSTFAVFPAQPVLLENNAIDVNKTFWKIIEPIHIGYVLDGQPVILATVEFDGEHVVRATVSKALLLVREGRVEIGKTVKLFDKELVDTRTIRLADISSPLPTKCYSMVVRLSDNNVTGVCIHHEDMSRIVLAARSLVVNAARRSHTDLIMIGLGPDPIDVFIVPRWLKRFTVVDVPSWNGMKFEVSVPVNLLDNNLVQCFDTGCRVLASLRRIGRLGAMSVYVARRLGGRGGWFLYPSFCRVRAVVSGDRYAYASIAADRVLIVRYLPESIDIDTTHTAVVFHIEACKSNGAKAVPATELYTMQANSRLYTIESIIVTNPKLIKTVEKILAGIAIIDNDKIIVDRYALDTLNSIKGVYVVAKPLGEQEGREGEKRVRGVKTGV